MNLFIDNQPVLLIDSEINDSACNYTQWHEIWEDGYMLLILHIQVMTTTRVTERILRSTVNLYTHGYVQSLILLKSFKIHDYYAL